MRRLESLAANSATLQAYLQEIARFPRLAVDQECELGRRIREQQDQAALNALVQANLRFVVSYAKRYRHLGVPLLDLIHEGNLGLIEAARHFDPARQRKFISTGAWWVRQSIMHRLAEAQAAALRAQVESQAAAPTTVEDLELSADEVEVLDDTVARNLLFALSPRPNDDEFDEALQDQALREIDDEPTRDVLVREFTAALGELEVEGRLVMRLRYGLHDDHPWTLEQIAERMRLNVAGVRRLETRAVQTLRRLQHLRGCLN